METILQLAARNTERAKQIVQATNIINIWESIGAEINLVGSLKMGLMMKHRDIDFHVYTPRVEGSSLGQIEILYSYFVVYVSPYAVDGICGVDYEITRSDILGGRHGCLDAVVVQSLGTVTLENPHLTILPSSLPLP